MPSFTVFKGSKDGKAVKSTTNKPDELTGDQVLVKVTASGVCGTGKSILIRHPSQQSPTLTGIANMSQIFTTYVTT